MIEDILRAYINFLRKNKGIFRFVTIVVLIAYSAAILFATGLISANLTLFVVSGAIVFVVIVVFLGVPSTGQYEETTGIDDFANLFREPLHETTRKNRRNLLISSTIGLVMSVGKIAPTEIKALGITLDAVEQNNLYLLVAGIVSYFIISFSVYIRSDLISAFLSAESKRNDLKYTLVGRILFDAVLPLIVGIASLGFLTTQFQQIC